MVEWSGSSQAIRELNRYASRLKPEGITGAVIDGRPRTFIVFDTGRYSTLD